MFTTVSLTFFRLLLWYAALLLGFAFSFVFLYDLCANSKGSNSTEDHFIYSTEDSQVTFMCIFHSLLKVLVMMTGEFDFGNMRFNSFPKSSYNIDDQYHSWISRLIFLAFLFLISIVLFSLLNAVAVSDIRDIRNKVLIILFF